MPNTARPPEIQARGYSEELPRTEVFGDKFWYGVMALAMAGGGCAVVGYLANLW
ncbi:MAG: hypothetical protein ACD_40C00256G0001 [uncultured bacterium]|nr:MAG: hypothetical protein ACD_40C00256G0001 [uncultured bacterium]